MRSSAKTSQVRATVNVVIVEDNPDDVALVRRALEASSFSGEFETNYAIHHVQTWHDASHLLAQGTPCDVILLDVGLPDLSGLELVETAITSQPGTPIVIMTGCDDDELARESIERGVQDYQVKGDHALHTLRRTIRYAIQRHSALLELERTRNEQLALKDRFLSHVSHELRTPLTAIHQFVGILQDGIAGEINAEQKEYLGIIHKNALQLRDMISDLMDVTRATTGKLSIQPRPTQLREALTHAVRSMRAEAEQRLIRLELAELPPLELVYVDRSRLQQVLDNLISNALKHTPQGGSVSVSAEPHDQGRIRITVTDTGCGFAPEAAERIFERLQQEEDDSEVSRKGLGLGLFICRELVKRHGGRIWADSKRGQGARFHFTLPIYSLAQLLRRVVVIRGELQHELALLTIRIRSTQHPGLPVGEHVLGWAYDQLEGMVFSRLDRVMPRASRSVNGVEPFFVAAHADAAGGEAMRRRLELRLAEFEELDRCTVEVTARQVPIPHAPDATQDECIEHAARAVEAIINAELESKES